MATADVETSQSEALHDTTTASNVKTNATKDGNKKSITTFLFSIVTKATLINAVYLVGYYNWISVAWLITPMILIETHNYWRETYKVNSKFLRKIARESAATNEKDVLLANIKDLPSWVCESVRLRVTNNVFLSCCLSNKFRNVFFYLFQVYFPDFQRCEWANSVSYTH